MEFALVAICRVPEFRRKGQSVRWALERGEGGAGRNPRHGQRKVPTRLDPKAKLPVLAVTFRMSSAVAGALSRGHKGLTASKETGAATKKEIRGAVCISLVVQSAEALLLMRRFELCWSAGRLGGAPETFYGSTLDGHGMFL